MLPPPVDPRSAPDLTGPVMMHQHWDDLAFLHWAVDPAEVPPREITGPGVITDDSSPYLAWVDVPTDVGTYAVLLVRTAADTAWLTERIVPPATLSEPVGG